MLIKIIKCLSISVFLLISNAYAQVVKPDTSSFFLDDIDEGNTIDTLNNENYYIPDDMIFVPSALIYDHAWNNNNIRFRKINPSEKKDTTLIIFNNNPDNNFYFPVRGKFLSGFGYRGRHFHTGVDIKLKNNDSVYSAMTGKVRIAKRFKGYGNVVVIRHYNGLETVYSHLSKICVKIDDEVAGGDLIGLGGRTGRATTEHLHFETRFLEHPINPSAFIDFENYRLKTDTLILTASTFSRLVLPPKKPIKRYKAYNPSTLDDLKDNNKNIQEKHLPEGEKKYHIIKKGDTLYQIARKHNTTVAKLCQINGINKNKILKIGTKIRTH